MGHTGTNRGLSTSLDILQEELEQGKLLQSKMMLSNAPSHPFLGGHAPRFGSSCCSWKMWGLQGQLRVWRKCESSGQEGEAGADDREHRAIKDNPNSQPLRASGGGVSGAALGLQRHHFLYSFFFFFFFPFCLFVFSRTAPMAYGGSQARGLNRSYSHQPTPQPQQRRIPAASVTYTTVHGNASSSTH